jgi:hypothetical protein
MLFSSSCNFWETERADFEGSPHELMRKSTVNDDDGAVERGESVGVDDDDVDRKRFCKRGSRFLMATLVPISWKQIPCQT